MVKYTPTSKPFNPKDYDDEYRARFSYLYARTLLEIEYAERSFTGRSNLKTLLKLKNHLAQLLGMEE